MPSCFMFWLVNYLHGNNRQHTILSTPYPPPYPHTPSSSHTSSWLHIPSPPLPPPSSSHISLWLHIPPPTPTPTPPFPPHTHHTNNSWHVRLLSIQHKLRELPNTTQLPPCCNNFKLNQFSHLYLKNLSMKLLSTDNKLTTLIPSCLN